jgi:hypothetical protein
MMVSMKLLTTKEGNRHFSEGRCGCGCVFAVTNAFILFMVSVSGDFLLEL